MRSSAGGVDASGAVADASVQACANVRPAWGRLGSSWGTATCRPSWPAGRARLAPPCSGPALRSSPAGGPDLPNPSQHHPPCTHPRPSCSTEGAGLQTGDASLNIEAPVVVMTTEILRNMLYRVDEDGGTAADRLKVTRMRAGVPRVQPVPGGHNFYF